MTATAKTIQNIDKIKKNNELINSIQDTYNYIKNKRLKEVKERKKLLRNSISFNDKNKQLLFEKIQKLEISELFEIAEDDSRDYDDRFMAINSIEHLIEDTRFIPNLLNLIINGPKGDPEFMHSCYKAILNIYIRDNK